MTIVGAVGGVVFAIAIIVIVLAIIISCHKTMTAGKKSRYHERDDRHQPADPNLRDDDKDNLISVDVLY